MAPKHFYKTKSNHKGVTLSTKQIVRGIQKAEYDGKDHRQERYVNAVGGNPHTPAMSGQKRNRMEREYGGAKLNPKMTAENEFLAASSGMRGKNSSTQFQGKTTQTFSWRASEHMRPEAVGGGLFHGAYSGGNSLLKAKTSKSVPAIGHQSARKNINGESLQTVNPFAIRLKVRGSSLKVDKGRQ
jgi:hypothetical protein